LAPPGAPQVVPSSVSTTDPWVAPKPEPLIVTCWPAEAVAGLSDAATGPAGGWSEVPMSKMCSWPWSAPWGSVTLLSVLLGSTGSDVSKMFVSTVCSPPVQPGQLRNVVDAATTLLNDVVPPPPLRVQSVRPSQNFA